MSLHLIRHGKPIASNGPRSSWPLDPDGMEDIVRLGESGVLPDQPTLYSSPEVRALETARLLCESEPVVAQALKEQERPNRLIDGFERLVVRSLHSPEEPAAKGWETALSVGNRMISFVSDLSATEEIVLVGHGTAFTILLARLTESPPDIDAWRAIRFPDHCALAKGRVVSKWGEWI